MKATVDRRVLAGFRCVDALSGSSILAPLNVSSAPLTLFRNRSGIFAVTSGPEPLRILTTQFLPSAASWPLPTQFPVTIEDPALRYLPRRADIWVPQPLPVPPPPQPPATSTTLGATTPQPTTSGPGTTVQATTTSGSPTTTLAATTTQAPLPQLQPGDPQDVLLYPTPAVSVGPNWALIRATVASDANPPVPLPWAVIQVLGLSNPPGVNNSPPAGVTNQNGEALLAVPGLGLKLSSSSSGPITETTTPVTVTVWFDPSSVNQAPGWVSNPDDILGNLTSTQWKTASQTAQLAPGQTVFVQLTISL